jgi:ABC-type lipoprotein export system ATPase subunit
MVTHDAEVAKHARRIIHIHDGVIVNGAVGAAAGLGEASL